jgi:hypothetical protein
VSARAKSAPPSIVAGAQAAWRDRVPFRVKFALVCAALLILGGAGVAVGTGAIEIGASRQVLNVAVSSLTLKGLEHDLPSLFDPQDIKSIDLGDTMPLAHPCFPSGVPKRFASDDEGSPPNVFESVTPFRATSWKRECSLAITRPGNDADLSLRGGGAGCSSSASVALTPGYVRRHNLCARDVAIQPDIKPEGAIRIAYASPRRADGKYRVILDNLGADAAAAVDADGLEVTLAEPLSDKKCGGIPGETVLFTSKHRGTVTLERLVFDPAGLRATISMSGPHTVALGTSRSPCESDEKSVTSWKLLAIVAGLFIGFVQSAAKFVEGLKKIFGSPSAKKGRGS